MLFGPTSKKTRRRSCVAMGTLFVLLPSLVGAAAQQGRLAPPASSSSQQGAPAQSELDRFVAGVGPLCLKAPARECIDRGFAYADADRDGRISPDEAKAVNRQVTAWTQSEASQRVPQDRQRVVLGLIVVQTVGIDNLVASYDANGDGFLSKEELLADVKLDQRPLPVVLSDPKSVDWDRLAGRAGVAAPLLRRLFPM